MVKRNSSTAPSPAVPHNKRRRFPGLVKWKKPRLLIAASLLVLVVGLLGIFHFTSQTRTPLTLAMVTTLTGPNAWMGQESLQAVQLYVNQVNQDGGVNGHPIQLQPFDDAFDAKTDPQALTAQQVAHRVVAGPSLMVLGPIYSQASLKPNSIYKAAHIPLLSGTVSSDGWTRDNPNAFRLRTDISSQNMMTATYMRQILGLSTATVVYANDNDFGIPTEKAFRDSFLQQGGNIAQTLSFDPGNYKQTDLDSIATTIRNHQPNSQIIYIAALDGPTADLVKALHRAGITTSIFCTTACSTSHFVSLGPEGFTDGIYAPAPVLLDSAPDEAQAFASLYQRTYGHAPSWPGTMFYETAQVAIEALRRANVQGTPESVSSDRALIVNQLNGMNSSQTNVEGINSQVYFDSNHNAVLPLRFGQFVQGRLRSLPIQLMEVNNPDQVDLPSLENAGEIVQTQDPTSHKVHVLLKQHVVYTGIDVNKVTSINLSSSTFTADFYLWMRFNGSEDATAITFTNASNVSFDPTNPLKKDTIDGLNYRLYHVTGDFKVNYDLHDYPFDRQQLTIGFQNAHLTDDRLTYAIDDLGLRLRPDDTPDPTTEATVFQTLGSWSYVSVQYASDTFTSHSTLGDPRNFDQQTQTAYSGLQVTATLQRKSLSYLINHLLPQLLLFLLVYASLFLRVEHLGDRLALIVTSLLASAVLLLSVNSELPEIGYVVSLDYIYYIFFGLCLVCIGVTLLMEWLEHLGKPQETVDGPAHNGKYQKAVERINFLLHVFYPITVALTIIYYLVTFSGRFT